MLNTIHCLSFSRNGELLIVKVKLTEFGAASPTSGISREDERNAALAARAQKGDYDEGIIECRF